MCSFENKKVILTEIGLKNLKNLKNRPIFKNQN
jgi:hypothetical protein